MPAAWEEEIGRREGNGPLERALAEREGKGGSERSESRKRREGGGGGGWEMRVQRRNEWKRNAQEYTYISGVRETPKEARENGGMQRGSEEEGREKF